MKIQNNNSNASTPLSGDTGTARLSRKDPTGSGSGPDHAGNTDTISSSDLVRKLQTDPAREARIDRLREQVQSGTYSVSARDVSARLIDAHLDDLTKRS